MGTVRVSLIERERIFWRIREDGKREGIEMKINMVTRDIEESF